MLLVRAILALTICFSNSDVVSQHLQSNVWVIDNNAAIKLDGKGKITARYTNNFLGNPTAIDYSDPFRTIVFYRAHQQIVMLNNDGVAIGQPISLMNFGLGQIWLACRSSRGGVWLYSYKQNQILLTNPQLTRIEQTISLENTTNRKEPDTLLEVDGIIYLGTANHIIERIDAYGTTLAPINAAYDSRFWITNSSLWIENKCRLEKRLISSPNQVDETYTFPCKNIPLIISNKPMHFNGFSISTCEKVYK